MMAPKKQRGLQARVMRRPKRAEFLERNAYRNWLIYEGYRLGGDLASLASAFFMSRQNLWNIIAPHNQGKMPAGWRKPDRADLAAR